MGSCQAAVCHLPPSLVVHDDKTVSHPSPLSQLSTGFSSWPPPHRAQLQASVSVKLIACNLKMAALGQSGPTGSTTCHLASAVQCHPVWESTEAGAGAMLTLLSLSK